MRVLVKQVEEWSMNMSVQVKEGVPWSMAVPIGGRGRPNERGIGMSSQPFSPREGGRGIVCDQARLRRGVINYA